MSNERNSKVITKLIYNINTDTLCLDLGGPQPVRYSEVGFVESGSIWGWWIQAAQCAVGSECSGKRMLCGLEWCISLPGSALLSLLPGAMGWTAFIPELLYSYFCLWVSHPWTETPVTVSQIKPLLYIVDIVSQQWGKWLRQDSSFLNENGYKDSFSRKTKYKCNEHKQTPNS